MRVLLTEPVTAKGEYRANKMNCTGLNLIWAPSAVNWTKINCLFSLYSPCDTTQINWTTSTYRSSIQSSSFALYRCCNAPELMVPTTLQSSIFLTFQDQMNRFPWLMCSLTKCQCRFSIACNHTRNKSGGTNLKVEIHIFKNLNCCTRSAFNSLNFFLHLCWLLHPVLCTLIFPDCTKQVNCCRFRRNWTEQRLQFGSSFPSLCIWL